MCYAQAPRRAGGAFQGLVFDFGNDDYWDPPAGPPLGHWTVNLSRFLCPSAACNGPAGEPASAPALRLTARRLPGGRWEVLVRAAGSGRARIDVRCPAPRSGARRALLSRDAALPATLSARVSCPSRPVAVAAPSGNR